MSRLRTLLIGAFSNKLTDQASLVGPLTKDIDIIGNAVRNLAAKLCKHADFSGGYWMRDFHKSRYRGKQGAQVLSIANGTKRTAFDI